MQVLTKDSLSKKNIFIFSICISTLPTQHAFKCSLLYFYKISEGKKCSNSVRLHNKISKIALFIVDHALVETSMAVLKQE